MAAVEGGKPKEPTHTSFLFAQILRSFDETIVVRAEKVNEARKHGTLRENTDWSTHWLAPARAIVGVPLQEVCLKIDPSPLIYLGYLAYSGSLGCVGIWGIRGYLGVLGAFEIFPLSPAALCFPLNEPARAVSLKALNKNPPAGTAPSALPEQPPSLSSGSP